jgi:ATP-dependent Lon protease
MTRQDEEEEKEGPPRGESPEFRLPDVLPVLPLRDTVVLPLAVTPLAVGQERSLRLVDAAMKGDRQIVLVKQTTDTKPAGPEDCRRVGVVATVHQMKRDGEGNVRLVVQGLARVRIVEFVETEPFLKARVVLAPEPLDNSMETEGLARSVKDLFRKWVEGSPDVPDIVGQAVEAIDDPRQLAHVVAATVPLDAAVRQELLEMEFVGAKLARLVTLVQHEIAVRDLGAKITSQTQEHMSKAQRDYFLREQLRTIQKELGEEDGDAVVVKELREKLDKLNLPEEAKREADRELGRLERLPSASAEHGMLRNFLEWISELPWNRTTETGIDVGKARVVLDEDHHGLEKVKERILEYLAVRKLRRERGLDTGEKSAEREPILCFVGPPGVGKTSLGQSIARAMGREFVRVSLGGVHDESEIRGHRRTYVGAMPGRIIQALRRAGTADPVFMLDEIDKVSASFQGDPAAALLEVLDPAQNGTFVDNYLGVPFDLSRALFICTANTTSTIAQPLLDRMELIQLAGYTEEEKIEIARKYLLPRQRQAAGLSADEIEIEDAALRRMVAEYTREAGVRSLERVVAKVCRKSALRVAGGELTKVTVTAEDVPALLGPSHQPPSTAERIDRPGVATGLAWTPVGGDILFVEASLVPSKDGKVILTGSLGDVMRESAQAAVSWIRSHASRIGASPTAFDQRDVHIHVPSGSIPKDGPSAGVTMVTALASAATGRLVRSDVAMTGEITLRGKVLPIGGVKEKALAAHRAGIRTILLPKWNMVDVDEIPAELRKELTFVPVETLDDVLAAALEQADVQTPTPEQQAA